MQLGHPHQQLRRACTPFLVLPLIGIALVQGIFRVLWSIQLLPQAWHEGMALGALATLPLCVWWRRTLRHFRCFNLPAHHYWRRNPFSRLLKNLPQPAKL